MILASRVIGLVLLVLWLFCIAGIRRAMQIRGTLTQATVFQYCILPLVVGLGLVVTGRLWFLAMLPVAWIFAIPFPSFFLFLFPLVSGWPIGTALADWRGGLLGVGLMLVVCSIVSGIIVSPRQTL